MTSIISNQPPTLSSSQLHPDTDRRLRLEREFFKDMVCCGVVLRDLFELHQHMEKAHGNNAPLPRRSPATTTTTTKKCVSSTLTGMKKSASASCLPSTAATLSSTAAASLNHPLVQSPAKSSSLLARSASALFSSSSTITKDDSVCIEDDQSSEATLYSDGIDLHSDQNVDEDLLVDLEELDLQMDGDRMQTDDEDDNCNDPLSKVIDSKDECSSANNQAKSSQSRLLLPSPEIPEDSQCIRLAECCDFSIFAPLESQSTVHSDITFWPLWSGIDANSKQEDNVESSLFMQSQEEPTFCGDWDPITALQEDPLFSPQAFAPVVMDLNPPVMLDVAASPEPKPAIQDTVACNTFASLSLPSPSLTASSSLPLSSEVFPSLDDPASATITSLAFVSSALAELAAAEATIEVRTTTTSLPPSPPQKSSSALSATSSRHSSSAATPKRKSSPKGQQSAGADSSNLSVKSDKKSPPHKITKKSETSGKPAKKLSTTIASVSEVSALVLPTPTEVTTVDDNSAAAPAPTPAKTSKGSKSEKSSLKRSGSSSLSKPWKKLKTSASNLLAAMAAGQQQKQQTQEPRSMSPEEAIVASFEQDSGESDNVLNIPIATTSSASSSSDMHDEMTDTPEAEDVSEEADAAEATGSQPSKSRTTTSKYTLPPVSRRYRLAILSSLDPESGEKKFSCPSCSKEYRNANGLRYHLNHVHADGVGIPDELYIVDK